MPTNRLICVIGASAIIALVVGGARIAFDKSLEGADLGSQSQVSGGAASRSIKFNKHILVDQFGYRPGDSKVAVIRDPVRGYDAGDRFSPGATYQVRRADNGAVAFEGMPVAWNHGEVEASSGDRGWWFDFSRLATPGTYFVFDKSNGTRSATFSVDQSVYKDVLKATARMYFYQRSGFAKVAPYAQRCWQDAAAYVGANQDTQAHDVTDRTNLSKVKDLSGGWFDAGDTNRYVKNAIQPVHQLLNAFQENPKAFTDDVNIPESGNLIPDLLDELDWELAWLKKMQYPDGSAALKVGGLTFARASPPSSDSSPRFYVPSCSSATIGVAGMFAHAAYVYRGVPQLAAKAQDLQGRAIKAWEKFRSSSSRDTHCDSGEVKVPGADMPAEAQDKEAVVAAIYLFALTDETPYNEFVKGHYTELRPYHDIGWSRYEPQQGQALLFYTTLPHADPRLKKQILADQRDHVRAGNQVYGADSADLYRSYLHDAQYHWGSNDVRADYGNDNMEAVLYGAAGQDATSLVNRALDTLHYFHGVNPFAKVYLSNMYEYGATLSVNEIYHAWFQPNCNQWFCIKTQWDDAVDSECGPAPGYLPGGPVANIVTAGIPASLIPPAGQPPQKSYRDDNRGYPDKAYVFTEPSIVYQGGYLQLLSRFAD
jgi:endoglucanase